MYTIGQMSQLCHISARRLRYFEAMGILKPAMLSEKGYRYYQAEQLSEIMTIAHLQHYGLTLTEIGQFLSGDETLKVQILRRQRAKNEQTLNTLQQSLADLTRDIEELEGTMTNNEQEAVITMLDPEQRVFGIRRLIEPQAIHQLFAELYQEVEAHGLKRAGTAQLVYCDQEYTPEQMEGEAQVQVVGEHEAVQTKAAQLCAAYIYHGAYEQIGQAYEIVGKWLGQHPEYEVVGAVIERFMKDEHQVQLDAELETGLLFPIKLR